MKANETLLFLRRMLQDFDAMGAVLPTFPAAASALCTEAVRRTGPRTILEVGPGTGPITTQLVRHLRPGDRLVLCELDPFFVDYLHRRFEREPLLARVRHQVEIVSGSVVEMPGEACFDDIISAIPFTRLEPEAIHAIFDTYKRLLKPGGTVNYLEYSGFRPTLALLFGGRFRRSEQCMRQYTEQYQCHLERIYANIPPANVRSLRFSEALPEDALRVRARWNSHRINLPGGVAKDAMDLIAGLGLLALTAGRRGARWWPIPAALSMLFAWFHRDPEREPRPDAGLVYSACDGRVMKVDTMRHPRLGDQEWIRICTFLSITDVHINRAPIGGRMCDTWEEPGGFLPAYNDDSELNASRYIVLQGPRGRCAVAQRAGFIARRIITWPQKGDLLAQGERYGLIRLGSRTDVLLPVDKVEITVRAGDKISAGESTIARWL